MEASTAGCRPSVALAWAAWPSGAAASAPAWSGRPAGAAARAPGDAEARAPGDAAARAPRAARASVASKSMAGGVGREGGAAGGGSSPSMAGGVGGEERATAGGVRVRKRRRNDALVRRTEGGTTGWGNESTRID